MKSNIKKYIGKSHLLTPACLLSCRSFSLQSNGDTETLHLNICIQNLNPCLHICLCLLLGFNHVHSVSVNRDQPLLDHFIRELTQK